MQVAKKKGIKKNKKAHKLQTEASTDEKNFAKEDKGSQLRKKKLAAAKKKKKTENRRQRLNERKPKKVADSSGDCEDILNDSVLPQKADSVKIKKGKVRKTTGKFITKKGKSTKMTGKFITGKDVVNIWDEEEKTGEGEEEEKGVETREGGRRTQKRKRPGKKHDGLCVSFVLTLSQTNIFLLLFLAHHLSGWKTC